MLNSQDNCSGRKKVVPLHIQSWLRRPAPRLRLNLPDAIAVRERVRKGAGPNDRLALNRDSESP